MIANGPPTRVDPPKPGSVVLRGDLVLGGNKNWVYKKKQTRNKITLNIDPWRCLAIIGMQVVS